MMAKKQQQVWVLVAKRGSPQNPVPEKKKTGFLVQGFVSCLPERCTCCLAWQGLRELAEICRGRGPLLHALGWEPSPHLVPHI